ncbi:MAG: molybdenum cofactor biosynthesis protein [Gaiellaceae bacterium]
MQVTVRLFAGLRDRAGWRERRVELPAGARIADVWPARGLAEEEPAGLLYAVNRSYAKREDELAEGDEVALLPPLSGGDFLLSEQPLSLESAVSEVGDEEAGAIATFVGTTRRSSRGRRVLRLEYEAYPGMAEQVMEEIAAELAERHDLLHVAIHHRVGTVQVGEPSVVIAVSAAHRQAALAACKEAIDTLKQRVPLWKKEVYEGGEEWIGQGS